MPYCPSCGGFHAEDATYCPFCGHLVGQAPLRQLPPRVSAVFGETFRAFWKGPTAWLVLISFVALLVNALVAVLGTLATLRATFGTFHLRRIVNTHCFVKVGNSGGTNYTYKLRSHCTVFPLPAQVGKLIVVGAISTLIFVAVATALYVVILRRTDRLFGSKDQWGLVPSGGALLRAIGRSIGWGLLALLALVGALIAVGLAFKVLSLLGVIGILLGVAGMVYLAVWWIVPFAVRLQFAWSRMLIDDQPLKPCWRAISQTMGQAWAYVGIQFGLGVFVYLVNLLLAALGPVGGLIEIPFQLTAGALELAFTVAVMRFLTRELGGRPPTADAPAAAS